MQNIFFTIIEVKFKPSLRDLFSINILTFFATIYSDLSIKYIGKVKDGACNWCAIVHEVKNIVDRILV